MQGSKQSLDLDIKQQTKGLTKEDRLRLKPKPIYTITYYTMVVGKPHTKVARTQDIALAVSWWITDWNKKPYMCEIASSKRGIKMLLEWLVNNDKRFYHLGYNTEDEFNQMTFEVSFSKLMGECHRSLSDFDNKVVRLSERIYTVAPFSVAY